MDREGVIKNLRACLLSAKGGVSIDNLNRDYRLLIDENIPFRKLGYPSLVAFLRTVPGIRTVDRGGECYIEAQPSKESAHLTKLVSGQKATSKKSRKKLVNTRKSTPFRQPITGKKNPYFIKGGNENFHPQLINRYPNVMKENTDPRNERQSTSLPLMEIPTKFTIHNYEKPRYIQSNTGIPPSSPSKRLKNRQTNSVLSSTNQSVNKSREDPHSKSNEMVVTPVISQKPKTANNNTENHNKGKNSNLSERLKVNSYVPPLPNLPTCVPTSSSQSEVLSPLSPAQLLAGGNIAQFQHNSTSSPMPTDLMKKNVPKPQSAVPDPRLELLNHAMALNLPQPIYRILPTKIKNTKESAVFAQVKIGPHGYASYPEEARSEDEAQKLAAKIALLDLKEKYGSPSSVMETTNKSVIKERVVAIVDSYPNGVFMHQVPIYYKQQYKEALPGNWQKAIEECPAIILEKGVDNSIILRRYVPSNGKALDVISPKKTDKIQLNPIGPSVPGQLKIPEEDVWIVFVIYVMSTVEVWVRLDAYKEQFDIMMAEMTKHYSTIQEPVKPPVIEIGNYYAIFEDESWHRVRCIENNSTTGSVTVSFIDLGDEDTFPSHKLLALDKKFCTLPAQAIRLSLFGLEDFSECECAQNYIEKLLLEREFYIEVIKREKSENKQSVSVVFYDTQGPDDVNLNSLLSKQILQHIISVPKLEVEGQIFEVFILHAETNGDIYVRIQSDSIKFLVNLLNRLIHTGLKPEDLKRSIVTTVDTKSIYFVFVQGNWYRGKVVNDNSSNQLKVFLIDSGKIVTTGKHNLLSLEKLSEVLTKYPPQALKIHLHNIDGSMFNEKMVAKLSELAPTGESLLMKVVTTARNETPTVELFKRIQPSNMLVSINNTLAYEEELTRSQGDGNNNIKPRKRTERLNSKTSLNDDDEVVKNLKPPKISGIGEYFDVHVTMAAHPGNFTVQPFEDKCSLEAMMIQLQETCLAYKGPHPTAETIREGKLYAAQHIDGHWYRVCISSIIREDMVSVYFCDFGDVSVLSLNKLQPLKSQFLELPYQAIKARLVGIQPVNIDWSVEDSLRFQELVVEKNFVSIVVESGPDDLSPADTVLGLKLIDVDTTEDIYIDKLLVDEGRAVYLNS